MRFDVFLSYASVDRTAVVEPLLSKLRERGVRSWCDIHEIRWGDSIIQKIQEGLAESRFVIAFISTTYVSRDWTMKELRTAMAQQISGRTTVLPVLLGISISDLERTFPFLLEIRHLNIFNYNETIPISEYEIVKLVQELELIQSSLNPIDVVGSLEVMKLRDEIKSISFNRHYEFYAVLTQHEYAEARLNDIHPIYVERSDISTILTLFIEYNGLSESDPFLLCFLDINRSVAPIFVLPSGNLIAPHRSDALSGDIKTDDYIKTGAPPNPCCVTEGQRGEVFLGYPNGMIFSWGRKGGITLFGHSLKITALDTSMESILASCDYSGNLGIWSRQDGALIKLVSVGSAPITCVSVSRNAGAALIAVGDEAGSLKLYTFEGKLELELPIHLERVGLVRFIPSTIPLLAYARGDSIEIFNYVKGQLLMSLRNHDGLITALHVTIRSNPSFSFPDRDQLSGNIVIVTAGFNDGYVHRWELKV